MKQTPHLVRKMAAPAASVVLVMLIAGSAAQTTPTMPTVDLSVGPVAINAQAVNVALALSVEWPTVGAAYRLSDYAPNTVYLGHFDTQGCYAYRDESASADAALKNGEYFYRTGTVTTVNNVVTCEAIESGGGRYSGNALNYITTSSIDMLRYALTGGNRVVDTPTATVLERAYLRNSWNLHDSNFPSKRIPQSLVGKVIPALSTGDVYGGGCKDKVWFGTSSTPVACDTAGTTSSGNLNQRIPNPSTLTTGKYLVGTPAPTGLTGMTLTKIDWDLSNPLRTQTSPPTTDSPLEPITVYASLPGTTTTAPPTGSGLSSSILSVSYVPVTTGITKGPSPVATSSYPTLGDEPNRNPTGYDTNTTGSGTFDTQNPGTGMNGINLGNSFTISNTSSTNRSWPVCQLNRRLVGATNNGTPINTGVTTSWCSSKLPGSTPTTLRTALGWSGSNNASQTATFYQLYNLVPYYQKYTVTNNYQNWEERTAWKIYDQYQYYTYYTGTQVAPMYARVRVCDDIEKTTRTDLCQRYPDGNYKPVGEVQRNATGIRMAAFGYLAEDGTGRYGGVLRAPMKYPGPTYVDQNGQPQTNAHTEWNANNGVFTVDPQGASPTYSRSGVINYLNKFGTTGTTLGYYKENDPVGELYYEALRYYQGLAPTASAISGTINADGYPVYTNWTDPLQNACERRNFILTIGDVNTHADRQLPGHKSSMATTADPARSAEPLLGDSSKTFDAAYWTDLLTGFETNPTTPKIYTDALGRSQNTAGNPNQNDNNINLATKGTGSNASSAYYWAGAAYWANTQPIRWDTKDGQSMKDVRVKTFTIDVDEGGNGSIEDSSPRAIKARRSSFYLAGKYGWFNDANLDGSPFKTSGGGINNKEWEDPSAPNTPDGYVIASQGQKMIEGIRKFFRAASSERGAVSVSAISTARFTLQTRSGDIFTPKFNPADWSGTIEKSALALNTTTGIVESMSNVAWDTSTLLTAASTMQAMTVPDPYVKPANRNIITFATDGAATKGVPFNVASKGELDSAVLTALGTNPSTGSADNLMDQRINWLRGDRSNELSSTGGMLRRRGSIMGDVINSGPVYKQDADSTLSGTGYLAFAQSAKTRTAVVYAGANDGMMHAFRATDGKELFAYIPRAVATHLNKLTHPNYAHRPYVDGVPQVGEAQVGSNWKTLLVSGMGGGAQGVFALDVTTPENFGVNNVMFEFTDADDADMGNVLTQPTLVKLKVPSATALSTPSYKWFVAVGSGYNNYRADGRASGTGAQALFFLSVDKAAGTSWQEGSNYFKVVLPVSSTTTANGLANPGVVTGVNGETTLLYAGDLQGNVWKVDLSDGINTTNIGTSVLQSSGTRIPIFVALDSTGARQPITTSPVVVEANAKGYMVLLGTGKFIEPSDATTAQTQSIYGIWDSLENTSTDFTIPRNKLYPRTATLTGTTVSLDSGTFSFGKGSGAYRGWRLDLPETRERIAVDPALLIGSATFNSATPEGTCSGDGSGRSYCLNPVYGTSVCGSTSSTQGIRGAPIPFQIELDASSYSTRSPTGRRTVTIEQQVISSGTKITSAGNSLISGQTLNQVSIPAGRVSWRELRN